MKLDFVSKPGNDNPKKLFQQIKSTSSDGNTAGDYSLDLVEGHGVLNDGLSQGNPAWSGALHQARVHQGLTRYVEPFFVYRGTLVTSVLVSLILGWLALLIWPRTYESTAKLQLLVGRESVGLDPSSTTTQTILMQKTVEEDVNSALEIMGSRDVAEAVVNEIGAENILEGTLPSSSGTQHAGHDFRDSISSLLRTGGIWALKLVDMSGVRDEISNRERALLMLQAGVSIYAPKKSSTMIISAESKSPEMAQAIVDSFTKHFVDRHVNVASTEGSYAFFEKQAIEAENQLAIIQKSKSELLQKHKLASVSTRFTALTSQQSTIETAILSSEAQVQQAQAELNDLKEQISEMNTEVVAGTQTQRDPTIGGMRVALYNAELEEKRLMARFREGHPMLEQVQEQVVAAREALDRLAQDSEIQNTTPNPIRLKLEEDQLRTSSRIVGLQSLLKESREQLVSKQREISELLELELELEQLDREIEAAKKSLILLREKEEQSRVIENLRQQRISSVGIAQSASLAEKASSPKKPLIAAAALMLGLGFGVCLVGLKEYTRKQFRNAEDIQRYLGYPVIAEVPYVRSLARTQPKQSNLLSRKAKSIRSACETIQSELMLTAPLIESGARGRIIGTLGVHDNVGTSSLAAVLALQLSENDVQRTTLIDLDRQKGTISSIFGISNTPVGTGLVEAQEVDNAFVHPLSDRSLSLVGSSSCNVLCLGKENVQNLLNMLHRAAEDSDVVIVDFPPVSRPERALSLTAHVDQILIVVESQETAIDAAQRLVRQIEKSGGEIAGVVLVKTQRYVPGWLERILG
jgi:uncharacterized protein involved in exopolysaccharide biosynthesis/Mrp family chromosome partitioning ATPase